MRLGGVTRPGLVVALLASLLAWVAGAEAQERHARTFLDWDPALVEAGCLSAEAVAAAVEARIRRPLGAQDRADAELVLEARRVEGEGLSAELTLARPGGEVLGVRRIETSERRCDTLDAGLPLVIAMLVDLHEREAVVALPEPTPTPTPPPIAAPPVAQTPPPPPNDGAWGTLEVGASMDGFGLPLAALGLEVVSGFSGSRGPLSGMARLAFVVPQTSYATGAVEVWGARGALGACLHAEPTGVALGGCVLVEGGALHITGQGFDVSRSGDAPHIAAVALLSGVLLALEPFTVRVELGASVPFVVQRFVYDDPGGSASFFVASPMTLRAGLLLGIRAF